MSTTPYTIDPVLTGLSLAYTNGELVADKVLPRVGVDGVNYKYWRWEFGQFVTVPDTTIGRKSEANQVEFQSTEIAAFTQDYGLSDMVPVSDTDRRPPNQPDPMQIAVMGTTGLVLLDRERRVANMVLNPANYPTANKATLSGTSQWSNAASDPVDDIMSALDVPIQRPNRAVMGRAVYTKLRQHPKVVAAVNSNGGNAAVGGVVERAAIANLFEVQEIIVSDAWINTSKKGQTVAMTRIWGKSCLFFYQNPIALQAASSQNITYGWTGEFQNRQVQTWFEPKVGVKGANAYKVVEQLGEHLAAPDLAFLFSNAVA